MSKITQILSSIPISHSKPLLEEYDAIVQNYMEKRWSPSEMSGGRFSEIVYSILLGIANRQFSPKPNKPKDMPTACKQLENQSGLPRSFQILIPRLLPALYEVRNHRGVGHVGGDVDPNHMDATLVLSIVNWIMAELVRELHALDISKAQEIVDKLAERRIPLIWEDGDIKRVLDAKMAIKDQILLLLASSNHGISIDDLLRWTEYKNKSNFMRILSRLHISRLIEMDKKTEVTKILPPGIKCIAALLEKKVAVA